jgi:hypothetical protein
LSSACGAKYKKTKFEIFSAQPGYGVQPGYGPQPGINIDIVCKKPNKLFIILHGDFQNKTKS